MATNPYVNKVVYGNQTVMDLTEDTVTPNDVLQGVTFHDKSGASQTGNVVTHNVIDNLNSESSEDALSARMGKKVNLSSNQKVVDAVGWDGRNYFHVDDTVVSGTENGITYTITRKNGEVTRIRCNGTPTSGDFTLWLGSWTYGGTSPILTGCPSGGGSQGTIVNYGMSAAENGGYQSVVTAGDEPAKLYEYFYSGSISISIIIKSGYTASNLDFYPMICSEELSDYDFKAHHDSVETLLGKKQNILTFDNTPTAGSNNPVKSSGIKAAIDTSASNVQSADIDLLKDTVGWTGKNLLDARLNTVSSNGITLTKNSDNSYIVSGVLTSDSVTFRIDQDTQYGNQHLHNYHGDYTLSLLDASGNYVANTALVLMQDSTWGTDFSADASNNGVVTKTQNRDNCFIYIQILNRADFSTPVTLYPMLRKAEVTDATFEPYHPSVKQTLRDAEVIEGKNKLHIPDSEVTNTTNGITFTFYRNSDGEVEYVNVNGTASATAECELIPEKGLEKIVTDKSLVLSGGISNSVKIYTQKSDDTYIINNGTERTIDAGSTFKKPLRIQVESGYTANNVKIYPMLRYASESDPTYEPYYIPLKDSKFDRAEQRVLGAKNLLPIKIEDLKTWNTSGTWNGNTYTHNSKAFACTVSGGYVTEITISGTPSATAEFVINRNGQCIESGKSYILSGCPSGGSASTYKLQYSNNVDTAFNEFGEGVEIVGFATSYAARLVKIMVYTGGTGTAIFKPMIRLASDPDDTYVPYAMTNKELTDSRDVWAATASVSNGSVTFTGIDDTGNNAYEVYFNITSSSSEKNPTAELTSISGEGTSSMTLTYSTNADNGTNNAKLRRIV